MDGTLAFVASGRDPRLSSIFAAKRGLPPILLLVSEAEVLHDDLVDFAARAAGAEAELWPGIVHVWPFFGPLLEEGRAAADRLGRFLGEFMAG